MKFKLKQNIGMSVHIDIEVTENEIKNEQAGAELCQAQSKLKLAGL